MNLSVDTNMPFSSQGSILRTLGTEHVLLSISERSSVQYYTIGTRIFCILGRTEAHRQLDARKHHTYNLNVQVLHS